VLKNPGDAVAARRVREVLDKLAADPAHGIARILDRAAIAELGGAPAAEFWVDLKPGTALSPILGGVTVLMAGRSGTHGFLPTHDEMRSLFILEGPGVKRGDVGEIDMRAIAPTLAQYLGARLPAAERPALPIVH
jgi:hypothetical protein